MPKKSGTARSGAQRHKQRPQKNFELVRQTSSTQDGVEELEAVAATSGVSTLVEEPATETQEVVKSSTPTAAKGSAAARLAARRQSAQKSQRATSTLITPEHYAYVRKDLIFIAVLASLMFITLIVLHFVLAIGS